MIVLVCINTNYSYFVGFTSDNINFFVTPSNMQGKWFVMIFSFLLDTHIHQIKIFNVINMLLMCLSRKDDHATPWADTFLDPTIC